jgi:predicted dehydrogenase
VTLKLAFIGTGGIAQAHLNNLSRIEGVTVSAFCDIDLNRAEQAASRWNDAKAFSDIDQMLDSGKYDGVYICIPPMAHGDAEYKVIERGLPFLVEKPLGIDRTLPQEIAAKVKEKGIITSVGYHWRYSDATQKARELLADAKLGMALGYWMGGMPMVPWWRIMKGSGGQFVEQTTHIVDLLRYMCGEVTEVYAAYGHRVMHEQVEGTDVPDIGTVTMKLANGSVATISNSCLLPAGDKVGLDIYTDKGLIEIGGGHVREVVRGKTTVYNNSTNPYNNEDLAFLHALRTGDASQILSDYEDALKTHMVTIAANESAESGKPVSLA